MKRILFLLPPTLQYSDFVSPPYNVGTIKKGDKEFGMVLTDLPLGIISLSAYLKKHIEVEVRTLDFNVILNKCSEFEHGSFHEYFLDQVQGFARDHAPPDFVGISALFTSSHQSILDLANVAKRVFPAARVLVGGNYPTAAYACLLRVSEDIDAICYGEGEKPLLELLTAGAFEPFVRKSEQWVNREKLNNPALRLSHNFIVDLDEIPPYDYDCVDVAGYRINPNSSRYAVKEKYKLSTAGDGDEFGEDTIGSVQAIGAIRYSMPIMTSRGCPFKCTFCASHVAHGRTMRYHSLERVAADIKLMVEKYGIDGVVIQDDHFMGGKNRPYQIVERIGSMGLGMYFQNALAIFALELPFLQLLKRSGVDSLVLPLESGSNRVLKELMNKPLRLALVPRVLKDCREAGIFTDVNIIIGMPGETHQDIEHSREFLKTIYADWFRIFSAMPISGSEMYERCKAEGLFEDSELDANYKRPVISTGALTPQEILEYTYSMNIELNFVHNSNLRLKKFDVALQSFLNVLKVKEDHAIAHFYVGVCHDGLGEPQAAAAAFRKAYRIAKSDPFWARYIAAFNIPVYEMLRGEQQPV